MDKWPLGVFASIDAGLGVRLEVAHELGVPTIQLHAPQKQTRTRQPRRALPGAARRTWASASRSCSAVSRARATPTFPRSCRTVGLVPPATRAARLAEMKEISDFARLLGVEAVGLHLGFVPHDAADPLYRDVVAVARELCDHCKANGQNLHLETGQESADALLRFLGEVGPRQSVCQLRSGEHDSLRLWRADRGPAQGGPLRAQRPLQGRQVGRAARAGLGRRSAAGRGRRRHGELPPHARTISATPVP